MKDRLQKVRQDLPEAIKRFQAVNAQVQGVEANVEDLRSWIDDGEKLLESHRLEDNTDTAEERLQKHRVSFASDCATASDKVCSASPIDKERPLTSEKDVNASLHILRRMIRFGFVHLFARTRHSELLHILDKV